MMANEHTITMQFDMTTEEGRTAHEYARLGRLLSLVLINLDSEMRRCVKYDAMPFDSDDGNLEDTLGYKDLHNAGILHATDYWRGRIYDLRDDYNIGTEW
jgi:hypothetical protein